MFKNAEKILMYSKNLSPVLTCIHKEVVAIDKPHKEDSTQSVLSRLSTIKFLKEDTYVNSANQIIYTVIKSGVSYV